MKFKSDVDVEAALAVSGNVEIGSSGQTTLNQTSTHFFMDMTSSTSYFRNTSTAGGGFIFRNSGIGDFEFDNEFAGNIKFNTSNSERMRINSAGNVGIGTTSPSAAIHIQKSISGGFGGTIYNTQATGGFGLSVRGGNSSSEDALRVQNVGGTYLLNVKGDGNVGIGITAPGQKLHVVGNAFLSSRSAYMASYNNTNSYHGSLVWSGLQLGNNGVNKIIAGRTGVGGSFQFWTNNTNNAADDQVTPDGTMAMSILSSGNVGIGTTSPTAAKLVVDSSTAPQILVKNSGGGNAKILFEDNSGLTQNASITFDQAGQNSLSITTGYVSTNDTNKIVLVPGETTAMTLRGGDDSTNTAGAIQLNGYLGTRQTGTPTYLLGTDASGNIVKTNTIPGSAAGPYLPLAGGTMTGNIVMGDNDITGIDQLTFSSGTYLTDASSNYVNLHYASSGDGGIYVSNSNGTQGYLYADGGTTSQFGLLTGAGSWAVRTVEQGLVELRHNNVAKLQTTTTGVTVTGAATATTFIGDLNGTINTVTTAVTKANATNDTTVATTAFVQNLIGTIPAGLVFQGTWNAATNTPTLTSGSGTTGNFYIVSTSGSTNLDGVTDWVTGDWAVFIEQGGTDAWEKIDNSSVLDGAGTGQTVALWSGSGTSNTLTDAPITVSGNNTTFAGNIISTQGGTAALPKITLSASTTTGIYTPVANGWGVSTNGVSRLVIDSAGDVGIGNTAPAAKLHVSGSVQLDVMPTNESEGSIKIGRYDANTSRYNLVKNFVSATAASNYMRFAVHNGTENATVDVMSLNGAGNVGIGTTDPVLYTNNWGRVLGIKAASGYAVTQIAGSNGNGAEIDLGDASIRHAAIASTPGSNLGFYTNSTNSGIGLTERMRILANGNVGIGTTNPVTKLEVDRDLQSDTINRANSAAYIRGQDIGLAIGQYASGPYGTWIQSISNTDATFPLTLNGLGGNVGIGTKSPDAKLEIYGYNSSRNTLENLLTLNGGSNSSNPYAGFGMGIKFNGRDYSNAVRDYAYIYGVIEDSTSSTTPAGDPGFEGQLRFYTNTGGASAALPTQKMVITSDGSVGIGAAAPTRKLQVDSAAGYALSLNSTQQYLMEFARDGVSEWWFAVNNGDFKFHENGAGDQVIIKAGGNVGIGMTTPYTKLVVGSRGTAAATSISAYDGIAFDFYNDGPPYKRHGVIISQAGDASESVLDFNTKAASGTNSTKMTILGNGNVGIGYTTPSDFTSVSADNLVIGPLSGNNGITVNSATTGYGALAFADGTGASDQYRGLVQYNHTADSLALFTNATTKMTILSGGNVGIGTTNPQSKLQVDGGIQMSDDTATAAAAKVGTMRYRTGTEYVEVDGVELIVNGDFATDSNWSKGANTTISGGSLNSTAAGDYVIANQSNVATQSKYYKWKVTYTITSGGVRLGFSNAVLTGSSQTSSGTYTGVQQASAGLDGHIYFTSPSSDFVGSIDNVSLIEVTAEDASYADMCMQTGSSTYEWVNIVRNTY